MEEAGKTGESDDLASDGSVVVRSDSLKDDGHDRLGR
jgi:hypothetical protein